MMKHFPVIVGFSVAILWFFGILLLQSLPQAVMGEIKTPFSGAEEIRLAPVAGQLAVLSWREEEYRSLQLGTSYQAQDVSGWLFDPRSLTFTKASILQNLAEMLKQYLSPGSASREAGRETRVQLIGTGNRLVLAGLDAYQPKAYLFDPASSEAKEMKLLSFGEYRSDIASLYSHSLIFEDLLGLDQNHFVFLIDPNSSAPWTDKRAFKLASQLVVVDLREALPSDQNLPEVEKNKYPVPSFQDAAGNERYSSEQLVMAGREILKISSRLLLVVGFGEKVKSTGGRSVPEAQFVVFDYKGGVFKQAGSFGSFEAKGTSQFSPYDLAFAYLGGGKLLAGGKRLEEGLPLFLADINQGTVKSLQTDSIDRWASTVLPDPSRKWERGLIYLEAGSEAFITADNFRELPEGIFKVTRSGKVTLASPRFLGAQPDFDRSSPDEAPTPILATARVGTNLFFFGQVRVVIYRYSNWPPLLEILLLLETLKLLLIGLVILIQRRKQPASSLH